MALESFISFSIHGPLLDVGVVRADRVGQGR